MHPTNSRDDDDDDEDEGQDIRYLIRNASKIITEDGIPSVQNVYIKHTKTQAPI